MTVVIRILTLLPKFLRGFRDFSIGFAAWTHADLDAIKKWFSSPPLVQQQMVQEQPALNVELERLFVLDLHHRDTQHEVIALRREMLTLPALPHEGY